MQKSRRRLFYPEYNGKPEPCGIQLWPELLKEGDEIAVTIMEHHSNLLPWQMVSRMTGAKLHYLECTSEGELTDEELQRALMREHVLWLLRRYRMCSAA